VRIRVLDTYDGPADDTQRNALSMRHFCWSDCVILVFSVISRKSFERITPFINEWKRHVRKTTDKSNAASGKRPRRASHGAATSSPTSPTRRRRDSHGLQQHEQPKQRKSHHDPPEAAAENQCACLVPRRRPGMPALVVAATKCELETAR